MHSQFSPRRRAAALAAAFCALTFAAASTAASSSPLTAPQTAVNSVEPLEIGPLAPLTTGWHEVGSMINAPAATAFPLRLEHSGGAKVTWTNAKVAHNSDTTSIARVFTQDPAEFLVTAVAVFPDGEVITSSLRVTVVDATPEAVQVTLDPFSDELLASTALPMYGGDLAIETTTELALTVTVSPPSLGNLVEWRFDGRSVLGTSVSHRFRNPGYHRLAVGPTNAAAVTDIESYRVKLDSAAPPKAVWDYGDPVELAFVATTTPSGYEASLNWTASTANGAVSTPSALGSSFTVLVSDYKEIDPCGKSVYSIAVSAGNSRFAIDADAEPCNDPCAEPVTPVGG